ncbi:DUF4349 domain-containing protein [Actinacidiphila paucisporea]|uniref:DUF4349 domain-containing protein n=1 Tax=Actinacidiphila paucisporea TaxID=310782 RepID=A0A1M7LHX1_9ACTN|nr:DUF4349 domain-containing protein [Actinacidiphila paucisporea]SHM77212.1 protein of unknown function [Actinacidiphila paucisporea]
MRPSTRRSTATSAGPAAGRHAPGARRRRRGAAVFAALLLAGALGVAGCGASSDKSSSADKAAAPAAGARSGQQAGTSGGGSSGSGADSGAVAQGSGGGSGTAPSAPSAGKGGRTPSLAPTYLVRTAELSVRTPRVEDALQQARTLVTRAGGYSGDEDTAVDAAGHATSTIQLRVPPAAYDQLLDELGGLGTLLGRKVSVDDVTGQVVDVRSRVKSQQASVDRVRKLMDQASGLTDVVSLESELSTREAALEALEAQQASLMAQADLATVTLRLSEPPVKAVVHKAPVKKKDGFWKTVGKALGGGWHAFYVTVRIVLVILAAVLPFLALGALTWVAVMLLRRWWPRTEPAAPPAKPSRPAGRLPQHPPVPGPRQDSPARASSQGAAEPPAEQEPPA